MAMENDDFKRIGEDLFGSGWQTRLARALGMDGSTVRRWVGAAVPVPPQIAAFMDLLGSRQEARGALVFAMQRVPAPVAASAAAPARLEGMRRRLVFPGVDAPKPMPSIRAFDAQGTIGLSLVGDPDHDIAVAGASYTITRHPDSRHISGYVDAARAEGHVPVVVSHRFHHYTLIAHAAVDVPSVTQQISTHSGTLRTVTRAVDGGGRIGEDALSVLPGGSALADD
jgi:hypothetical protein